MAREALVGVDVGTSVLKAAAFDADTGKALARASRRLGVETGPDGRREQSPEALLRAFRSAVRAVARDAGRPVAGLGLAAQGGSAVVAERRTGRTLTPLMLWNDTRAFAYLPRVKEMVARGYWRELSWRDEPGWGLARIMWLRETRPGLLAAGNVYAGAGDFLFHSITGQWRQDAGNALQTGCFNVPERRLVAAPLELVGADLALVSELRLGHESRPLSREGARVLGLREGVPAAGPYMDHEAGWLSAGGVSERPLQCSLGTAWVGNFLLPVDAEWRSPFQLVVPATGGEGWLVVQPLLTGNVTWDWAVATFAPRGRGKGGLGSAGRIFADALLPPEGLVALPWLNMPNPLAPGRIGGGAILGVGPHTARADILRAVAAAMCCEMARVFAEVRDSGAVDSVVLSGGASAGAHFLRVLATLYRPLPCSVFADEGWSGTRGALAAFSERVARSAARRVKPARGREADAVCRAFERYCDAFERLYAHVPGGGPLTFAREPAKRGKGARV